MKINSIVYVVVGVIALIGAAFCAYLLFMLGGMVGMINSATISDIPPGTDIVGLQENAKAIGTVVAIGWIWVISVIACGGLTIKAGIDPLRRKK